MSAAAGSAAGPPGGAAGSAAGPPGGAALQMGVIVVKLCNYIVT